MVANGQRYGLVAGNGFQTVMGKQKENKNQSIL